MALDELTLSIIIPNFNSGSRLRKTLYSIISQTFTNYEVLIIDKCSNDGTLDIIKNYASLHDNIRWVSEPDKGIYDAMNKGIKLAKGEWLYFMGSDDVLYDASVISKIFQFKIENYHVIYGDVIFKHSRKLYDNKFNWYKLLNRNICHQAIFYKNIIFKQLGHYNTRYKMLADWEFNMRWFNIQSFKRKYINQIIAVYNEDGACFNNPDLAFNEDYEHLVKTHFSFTKQILWNHRNKPIINKLLPLIFN